MTIARGYNSHKLRVCVVWELIVFHFIALSKTESKLHAEFLGLITNFFLRSLFFQSLVNLLHQLILLLTSFILAFLYDDTPNWLLNEEFENTVIEDLGVFIVDIGSDIDRWVGVKKSRVESQWWHVFNECMYVCMWHVCMQWGSLVHVCVYFLSASLFTTYFYTSFHSTLYVWVEILQNSVKVLQAIYFRLVWLQLAALDSLFRKANRIGITK